MNFANEGNETIVVVVDRIYDGQKVRLTADVVGTQGDAAHMRSMLENAPLTRSSEGGGFNLKLLRGDTVSISRFLMEWLDE